jgi:hypothetical protein
MTDTKIVPFGKYKGQPIERMLADQSYLQWLMAQDWFREKPLYQVIINYGAEPQETPEHNALQVMFLDKSFCERFVEHIVGGREAAMSTNIKATESAERVDVRFPSRVDYRDQRMKELGIRAGMPIHPTDMRELCKAPDYAAKYEAAVAAFRAHSAAWNEANAEYELKRAAFASLTAETIVKVEDSRWTIEPTFEVGRPPVDVLLDCKLSADLRAIYHKDLLRADKVWTQPCFVARLRVELKPVVSDDYPSVLRQMKANGCTILLTRDYTGVGATREQFLAFFRTAGITVIFLNEIA